MTSAVFLALLALCSCLFAFTQGKTVTGTFHLEAGDLNHGPEYEITKYSFAVGMGIVEGKFVYTNAKNWMTSPALYLFSDDQWDNYHNAIACTDKIVFASASIPIGSTTRSHHQILKDHFGQATNSKEMPTRDGRTEWTFQWKINHETRTHGWFVVAADCALEQYNSKVSPMEFSISLFNPGMTHLPADEFGLPRVYLFVFILMSFYFAYMVFTTYKQSQTGWKLHLVCGLLIFAFGLQYMSIFYELIHLFFYKRNGQGIKLCDFLSEVFEGLSQTLMAFVLICLASGWTLVDLDYDTSRGNSVAMLLRNPDRLLKGFNAVILVIILFVIGSFFLQLLNKSFDDDFTKFHDYETTPGTILVILRLVLGFCFVYSFHVTIQFQQNRGGDKLLGFLKRLRLLGGLWFLGFPLLVFLAGGLPHYLRHRFVSTGVLTFQTLLLMGLGYQFISESSTYYKISSLADSGVLPGAGGFVKAPKVSRD